MDERMQDMWWVVVNATDLDGRTVHSKRLNGVVDLPRPMTAADAASCALGAALSQYRPWVMGSVTVSVWGRTRKGPDLIHQCTATAEYDKEQKKHVRYTPWLGDGEYREIESPEGAVIRIFSER